MRFFELSQAQLSGATKVEFVNGTAPNVLIAVLIAEGGE